MVPWFIASVLARMASGATIRGLAVVNTGQWRQPRNGVVTRFAQTGCQWMG